MSDLPDFGVKNKQVLISGGAGGIGGAFARAFAAAGAGVTIADITPPGGDLIRPGIFFAPLDVRSDAAIGALAARIEALDVLIHCAGRLAPQQEYEIDIFKDIIDIHLMGAMRLANAFRPHLRAARGCIINIASIYSYFGSSRIPAYSAAKTAIVGLTRSLALGFAEDAIRVNAIAPGWIKTEISRGARENPAFNAKVLDRLALRRWSDPEELAGTAIFLASPASSLINGVTIPVDGGYVAG